MSEMTRRLKAWIGAVGNHGDAKDMKDAVEAAQERVGYVLKVGAAINPEMFEKLQKANEHLATILKYLNKPGKMLKNYEAVKGIYEALQILNDDSIIQRNPGKAAAAFDKLFVNCGYIAKQVLPPPFDSTVGEFLEGFETFFSDMERIMNPLTNPQHLDNINAANNPG